MTTRCDLKTTEGLNLHCALGGAGRDVVLIHGSLSVLEDMLLGPFDLLAETCRVVAFDRPGHGRSERRRLDGSIWRQAEILHAGAIQLGLRRPVLVGHSFGAAVALAYALTYPDAVSGLVLLAPIAMPELRAEHLLFGPRATPVIGDILAQTAGPPLDAALGPLLVKAMFAPQEIPPRFLEGFPFELVMRPKQMQANGEDAVQALNGLALAAFSYPRLASPARVLGGDADWVVNHELHGKALARLAPDASFTSLPGLGHMLHHFDPEAVAAAVRELSCLP